MGNESALACARAASTHSWGNLRGDLVPLLLPMVQPDVVGPETTDHGTFHCLRRVEEVRLMGPKRGFVSEFYVTKLFTNFHPLVVRGGGVSFEELYQLVFLFF